MNTLRVFFLLLLMTLIFMGVGYAVGRQSGMIIAFALAAIMNFFSYWYSSKWVLKRYKAHEVTEATHRRLHRIASNVALKASIPMPRIYIVPSKAPNAFATGRNENHAVVAVTEGLLELLSDDELEGVIGHEMAHIRNKDMLVGTIAATLAGAIAMVAMMARWGFVLGGLSRNDRAGSPLATLAAMIVAPIAAMLIQMAVSRSREYKADAESVRITGHSRPLARALAKLHSTPIRLNLDRTPETAHLFIANPLSGKGLSSLFSTHPPVEKRIEKLEEMALAGYGG
jgi:heat shock protein HtpX